MSLLNIHVSNPVYPDPVPAPNLFYRAAVRLGLSAAVVIAIINLAIMLVTEGNVLEWPHMFIFVILFGCIAWGMQSKRSWITRETEAQDRVVFGMLSAGTAAVGLMVINAALSLISYRFIVSETFVPINDPLRFALSSMALFLGCIVFGLISSIVLNFHYGDDGKATAVMPPNQAGPDDPLERHQREGL